MNETAWLAGTGPAPMLEFLQDKASDRKLRLFAAACSRRLWHLMTVPCSRQAIEVAERFADPLVGDEERKHVRDTAFSVVDWGAGWIKAYAFVSAVFAASDPGDVHPWDMTGRLIWGDLTSPPRELCCPLSNAAGAARCAAYAVAFEGQARRWERLATAPLWQRLWHRAKQTIRGEGPLSDIFGLCPDAHAAELHEQTAILRDLFAPPSFDAVSLAPAWLTPDVVSLARAVYEERDLPSGHLDVVRLAILADALEEAGCSEQIVLDHLRGPGPHGRGCWPLDLVLRKE
jgi:hypothetical protein